MGFKMKKKYLATFDYHFGPLGPLFNILNWKHEKQEYENNNNKSLI